MLTTPTITLPFDGRISPHARFAEEHGQRWARRLNLVYSTAARQRLDACAFGEFSAWTLPTAASDDLAVYAQWIIWEFLADDQSEEGRYNTPATWASIIAHVLPVLEAGEVRRPKPPVLVVALADTLRHVYPRVSPVWRARFAGHTRDTFHAALREKHHQA